MAKNYLKTLAKTARENQSLVCFGIDPDLSKITTATGNPKAGANEVVDYYTKILSALQSSPDAKVSAVKPNLAYFAQYGLPGYRALKNIIRAARKHKLPVILDGKRGDIGRSSTAYAQELFEFLKGDAVTVSPYMGSDSVEPFLAHDASDTSGNGKHTAPSHGAYILCRTSNPGASDFQALDCGGKKLYEKVAEKIVEWQKDGQAIPGAVVGATSPAELEHIAKYFHSTGKKVPLLIPGVGAQGGSAKEVAIILRNISSKDLGLHRINSSSGIAFACEKTKTGDYVAAAVEEVRKMNKEIGTVE